MNITIRDWVIITIIFFAGLAYIAKAGEGVAVNKLHSSESSMVRQ